MHACNLRLPTKHSFGRLLAILSILLVTASLPAQVEPVGTAFTYQGRLELSGIPVNTPHDFFFQLFDDETLIDDFLADDVPVEDGLFSIVIDFGPGVFADNGLLLAINTRPGSSTGGFSSLGSKRIYAPPYSSDGHSLNAPDNSVINALYVDADGEVGIGTTSPGSKLQVEGTTRLNGNVSAGAATNSASGTVSAVIGGTSNTSAGLGAFVGGADNSSANGDYSAVIGSSGSTAGSGTVLRAAVLGGSSHIASGTNSVVAGGSTNRTVGLDSGVMAGQRHEAKGPGSVIVGGNESETGADGFFQAVAGGEFNAANGRASFVGGGHTNAANGSQSAVIGGQDAQAGGLNSVVAGGVNSDAFGSGSAVVGANIGIVQAAAIYSVAAGGQQNTISSAITFIGGGQNQTARGEASAIVGGRNNVTEGDASVVLGGVANVASGNQSIAMGSGAVAAHDRSFVWASGTEGATFSSTREGEFAAQALGGAMFATSGPTADGQRAASGIRLEPGAGAWTALSDANTKENFATIDTVDVLNRVVSMPITRWNWKAQGADAVHLGPTAQDFFAAFGLGTTDRGIATVDADGVALAAIQGLNAKLEHENTQLRGELDAKDARIDRLEARLTRLEQHLAD